MEKINSNDIVDVGTLPKKIEKSETIEKTLSHEIKKISKLLEKSEGSNSVEKIDAILVELALIQKQNQVILGIPGQEHGSQLPNVLQSSDYWQISNIRHLAELKKRLILSNNDTLDIFTGGGSLGVGYLGVLLNEYESGKNHDIILGYSAGALFPALFLLYKKAREVNPEKIGDGITSILNILPDGLEGKNMFFHGEELIHSFQITAQKLISIANDKLPEGKKMPNIDAMTIGELSENFKILVSRKLDEGYQDVIFGGKDSLLSSIIASSNPKIQVGPISVNVLTSIKNKFYSNEWGDGYYINKVIPYYSDILNTQNIHEYVVLDKYSNSSDFMKGKQNFIWTQINDLESFINGNNMNNNTESHAIGGWGIFDMKLKIIKGYYSPLSLANIGFFLDDVEKNINDIGYLSHVVNILLESSYQNSSVGDYNQINISIQKIKNLPGLSNTLKHKILLKIFYFDTGIEQESSRVGEDKQEPNIDSFAQEINEINKINPPKYILKHEFLTDFLPDYTNNMGILPYNKKILSYYMANIYDKNIEKNILKYISKEELLKYIADKPEILAATFLHTSFLDNIETPQVIIWLEYYIQISSPLERGTIYAFYKEKLKKLNRERDLILLKQSIAEYK